LPELVMRQQLSTVFAPVQGRDVEQQVIHSQLDE
jgi:hypothetical protein